MERFIGFIGIVVLLALLLQCPITVEKFNWRLIFWGIVTAIIICIIHLENAYWTTIFWGS